MEPIIHKFLREVPFDTPERIERCAIVRWFDENTLAKFVGVEEPQVVIDHLRRLSFVEARNYGVAFHDLVRDSICQELSRQSPARYRDLHREAASYYRQRILHSSRESAQRLVVEMVYHLMRADEDEGTTQLEVILASVKAFLQLDLATALLETTDDLMLHDTNRLKIKKWKTALLTGKYAQ